MYEVIFLHTIWHPAGALFTFIPKTGLVKLNLKMDIFWCFAKENFTVKLIKKLFNTLPRMLQLLNIIILLSFLPVYSSCFEFKICIVYRYKLCQAHV